MAHDILNYLRTETRPFDEADITDVDLLAFSAAMYVEWERFDRYYEAGASTPLSAVEGSGTFDAYAEHDYHPADTAELLRLIAASPRFGRVPIERFACIVKDEPPLQFGAACFPISDERVVVAFRGTDMKLAGWLEDFEMTWREEAPGLTEALRYLHRAAAAYPEASLIVCGHSKGGTYAEYATVFADEALAARIERTCSFDGPSLFRNGGAAELDLEAYDHALFERYAEVKSPITRYVFASSIGLFLERRDPRVIAGSDRFPFVQSIDPARDHSVFAAHIADGAFVLESMDAETVRKKMGSARFVSAFTVAERKFFTDTLAEACRNASVTQGITNEGAAHLGNAMTAWYLSAPLGKKLALHRLMLKAALAGVLSR